MLDNNKHIDSLFADKLKDLSVQPRPGVWEGINSQLVAKRRKRRMVIIISTAMAASLLLLFSLSNRELLQFEPSDLQLNQVAENTSAESSETGTDQEAKTEDLIPATDDNAGDEIIPGAKKALINNQQHVIAVANESESIPEKWIFDLKAKSILNPKLSNLNMEIPDQLALSFQDFNKTEPVLSLAEKLQIQNNLMMIDQLKKEEESVENKWSVIGQVSSAYSSYSGKKSGNKNESGLWSVGGGVKVNYAVGKKLALQTGVLYNRFGQDLTSGGDMAFMANNDALGPSEEKSLTPVPTETSAGPIKLNSGPARVSNEYSENVNLASYSSSDLTQSFETIEIPFLLRYNLSQKRLGVFVTGGLSANWIVENAVYRNNGGRTKIGETDNIRTTNFSSQLGFGLEYRLNSRFQIGLEPSVKYYLNSINKSGEYDYKPYSIGIFTGIRYNF